ncbi:MAG: hypothetical protein R3E39_16310 [Anaerolineae bacterium]
MTLVRHTVRRWAGRILVFFTWVYGLLVCSMMVLHYGGGPAELVAKTQHCFAVVSAACAHPLSIVRGIQKMVVGRTDRATLLDVHTVYGHLFVPRVVAVTDGAVQVHL